MSGLSPGPSWSSSFAFWSSLARSPGQRTDEELELIFEELLHIKAVAHLSNSVSRRPRPAPPCPFPRSLLSCDHPRSPGVRQLLAQKTRPSPSAYGLEISI